MSLIVNYQKLDGSALDDPKHPLHEHAKEYDRGLKDLLERYPGKEIKFIRQGYPKMVTYVDPLSGKESEIPEDVPPMRFSLRANVSHPKRGKEQWAVCLGAPYALPGGLWDIGGKLDTKSKQVTNGMRVNLIDEPDLAFFMVYKSPLVRNGHWKIDDPVADVKAQGNIRRQNLERETAIWQKLDDEDRLRTLAGAYGISDVNTKEPDAIRLELEKVLKENDQKKKKDPSYKGTAEFLEDMKITDYVRLSAFIRHWMDEGMIKYSPDGRYKVGDKVVAHVPTEQILKKFPWLCNYFSAPNNVDKLQGLFKDLINKDYLDTLTDPKDFRWIASVMAIEGFYNKKAEEVKQLVYNTFVI